MAAIDGPRRLPRQITGQLLPTLRRLTEPAGAGDAALGQASAARLRTCFFATERRIPIDERNPTGRTCRSPERGKALRNYGCN